MARRDLYTGKAGEHAVISQLLIREWQVAAPEVDVGDDLLIAMDLARILRVQVKTCRVARLEITLYAPTKVERLRPQSHPATPRA